MSQVTIKNASSATVVIAAANMNFRRELIPGRSISVPDKVYEELNFDPGFNALVDGHYIKVEGIAREIEEAKVSVSHKTTEVYDTQAIAKMYDEQNFTAFTKFIQNAAPAEKETAVKLAIDKGITAGGFTALIKKYCGVDVINAIAMKHQAEE
jgi:hypothetical protein